jgi:hypothetical protein
MFLQSYGMMFNAAQASNRAFGFMGANQGRMHLANVARPDLTPPQVAGLHKMDQALEMKGIQDKLNYEVAQLRFEAAQKQFKKDMERKRQAIENGWLG